MAKKFGSAARDYVPPSDDDVWIKKPKPGDTRLRVVQPTKSFHTWREHYVEGIGSFFCDDSPECFGCKSEVEKEARKSRFYGFNALEANGRLSVFKIGVKFYTKLQNREQRAGGSLTDRDYTIIRSGTGLETDYDLDPGEKYQVELPEEIYDIENAIGRKYYAAMGEYGKEFDVDDMAEVEPIYVNRLEYISRFDEAPDLVGSATAAKPEQPKSAVKAPAKAVSTRIAPAAHKAVAAAEPDEAQSTVGETEQSPARLVVSALPTTQLKAFLDEAGVEYPNRAPRSRLVAIAQEWQAANPDF